jgi:uncharacterized metal-binding protein
MSRRKATSKLNSENIGPVKRIRPIAADSTWQAIDSAIPMGLSVVEAGTRLLKDECPLAHCALCCLSRNGVRGDEKLARSGVSSAVTGIGNLGGIRLG